MLDLKKLECFSKKEKAIEAVTRNGFNLQHCTLELQNDEEVVMVAIKENSWAFECASATLKNNKDFILKALSEGIEPWGLIKYANVTIQSNLEIMTLAVEKNHDGCVFTIAQGEAALNKELAAQAIVKWGAIFNGKQINSIWEDLHSTLQEFFPQDSFYETAKAYLIQLEQEKQAEKVSGGSTAEDEVIW